MIPFFSLTSSLSLCVFAIYLVGDVRSTFSVFYRKKILLISLIINIVSGFASLLTKRYIVYGSFFEEPVTYVVFPTLAFSISTVYYIPLIISLLCRLFGKNNIKKTKLVVLHKGDYEVDNQIRMLVSGDMNADSVVLYKDQSVRKMFGCYKHIKQDSEYDGIRLLFCV